MTSLLGAFNNHFIEFLEDIQNIFPKDRDVKTAITALTLLKKANPRCIVLIWKEHIGIPYKSEIEAGDISFFVDKDYTSVIFNTNGYNSNKSNKILESVDRLRIPVRNMGADNQKKAMKIYSKFNKN